MLVICSFEYFFVLAISGLFVHCVISLKSNREQKRIQLFSGFVLLFMLGWRSFFPYVESSRYYASLLLWLIICAACFYPDIKDMIQFVTKKRRNGMLVFGLLFLTICMVCCLKKIMKYNPYANYIPTISDVVSRDHSETNDCLLICWDNNLPRFSWYTGIENGYSASDFDWNNKPDRSQIKELTKQFRYYAGTVYFFVPGTANDLITSEDCSVRKSEWKHLAASLTNTKKNKELYIYRMSGGDLLKDEWPATGNEIMLINGDFEGKSSRETGFITTDASATIKIGTWPEGWIPLYAKKGVGEIGLGQGESGKCLCWNGKGEVIVSNQRMIPEKEPLLLSFSLDGDPGSVISIIQDRFDESNKFLDRRYVAYLRISQTKQKTVRILLLGKDDFDTNKAFYRIGVIFRKGQIHLDNWRLHEFAKSA